MKMIIKKVKLTTPLLALLSFALFSFSGNKGGEGFEVYVNNKLVLQQFGNQMNTVKSIQLDKSVSSSQLSVKYHHCGHIGKNRVIAIKDANNKTLKEWRYADVSASSVISSDPSMNCKVSDILGLQKNNPGKLSLYYSSTELPKGRLLATIILSADNIAKN